MKMTEQQRLEYKLYRAACRVLARPDMRSELLELLRRFPGTSVATRKEIVVCKRLIKILKGDQK